MTARYFVKMRSKKIKNSFKKENKIRKNKGFFIVFEGLDGCGKTTQLLRFKNDLENHFFKELKNYKVLMDKEPTKGKYGKLIRKILKGKIPAVSNLEMQKLFVADRYAHQKKIIAALSQKKIFLCDRYFMSTIAYGMADGLSKKKLIDMNKNFIKPDLTFIFDINPMLALKRITVSRSGIEHFEKYNILKKTRLAYKELAKNFDNVFILNGSKSIEKVNSEIKKVFKSLMLKKGFS